MVSLSREQVKRYSRQLILQPLGVEGQKKLLGARVVLIGAGALGSPAALYLAASGIGRLGVVDSDVVELSNLHRQIMMHTHDTGKSKVAAAADILGQINPDTEVVQHPVRLTSENALDILSGYDVVIDGSDNFPTKYLVNDACVFLGKPNVQGGILHFLGRVTVFLPEQGCYRCQFPDPPPPGMVPTCNEVGVLGAVPGVIGVIQATEVIKLILGIGDTLAGRMLYYDSLALSFREAGLKRNPHCPVCGDNPGITQLVDYELFCPAQFPGRPCPPVTHT